MTINAETTEMSREEMERVQGGQDAAPGPSLVKFHLIRYTEAA